MRKALEVAAYTAIIGLLILVLHRVVGVDDRVGEGMKNRPPPSSMTSTWDTPTGTDSLTTHQGPRQELDDWIRFHVRSVAAKRKGP